MLVWIQHISKAKLAEIADTHGVQNPVQMIAFMLYHACMKTVYRAVY